MLKATLLEKVYSSFPLISFKPLLSSLCQGLNVKSKVVGKTNRGWIQIELSGEDELVAMHLLDKKIGLTPLGIDRLGKFSVLQGKVVFSRKSTEVLYVDVGISFPETCDAAIPIQKLQAQLTDGGRFPIRQLIHLFGMHDNMPLEVKITDNRKVKTGTIEAEMSERQLSQFSRWIRFGFDQLFVLGGLLSDIMRAVKMSGHSRDVIRIESLGFLEHVVLCKLGTDSVGLIPRLGRHLSKAVLIPFSPGKIKRLIKRPFL